MSRGAANDSSLPARKREVRRSLRARLSSLSAQQRHDHSLAIGQRLAGIADWNSARTIMLYLSLPDEVETRPLVLRAIEESKRVVVPKIVDPLTREMVPVPVHSLADEELQLAHYGIPIPRSDHQPPPIDEIDLVVIPGLGFSRRGQRIGRGLGYYDRFLALPELRALVCGLAFGVQVVDDLPAGEHDRPVNVLVTEEAVVRF